MLSSRPEEQTVLFKEVVYKKLTVREAEAIARRIAQDRVRKKEHKYDPEIIELEQKLMDSLGTRVQIESREVGGKIVIDFFSNSDLHSLLEMLHVQAQLTASQDGTSEDKVIFEKEGTLESVDGGGQVEEASEDSIEKQAEESSNEDDELYSVRNFSV